MRTFFLILFSVVAYASCGIITMIDFKIKRARAAMLMILFWPLAYLYILAVMAWLAWAFIFRKRPKSHPVNPEKTTPKLKPLCDCDPRKEPANSPRPTYRYEPGKGVIHLRCGRPVQRTFDLEA